jgi:hypothetical protein
LILNEKEVEEIMSHVGGTFAVISIKRGEFKGHHLLKIAREKAVKVCIAGNSNLVGCDKETIYRWKLTRWQQVVNSPSSESE